MGDGKKRKQRKRLARRIPLSHSNSTSNNYDRGSSSWNGSDSRGDAASVTSTTGILQLKELVNKSKLLFCHQKDFVLVQLCKLQSSRRTLTTSRVFSSRPSKESVRWLRTMIRLRSSISMRSRQRYVACLRLKSTSPTRDTCLTHGQLSRPRLSALRELEFGRKVAWERPWKRAQQSRRRS